MKTAEYVRKGHPDRVCDIMSDAIVDAYLEQDPESRIAVDVFGCHNVITIGGEVTSNAKIDIPIIVKNVYKEIGYKDIIGTNVNITQQSPEISSLANDGAGDSGIMIGYATRETPEMIPLETALAKRIADKLDEIECLLPDGKVQVTLIGDYIKKLVISFQTKKGTENDSISIIKQKIKELVPNNLNQDTEWILIPFNIGGFDADSGLTGRKNVLWYGPRIATGGGAFAGKDATKVDRSGAYFARWLAIDHLKKFLNCKEAFVSIAFVIGQDEPVMLKLNDLEYLDKTGDITVKSIIERLNLKKPIFKETSLRGHFGTNMFNWDK